jgi:hypothetical protein
MLLVLTVLAVSGMSTASLDLMMAGNTQYAQNAFQAAESGIEQALVANDFNPDPTLDPETEEDVPLGVGSYTVTTTPQLDGKDQPPLPSSGSSGAKYVTYHFEIDSTGMSKRGATARNVQAVAVLSPPPESEGAEGDGAGGTASKTIE